MQLLALSAALATAAAQQGMGAGGTTTARRSLQELADGDLLPGNEVATLPLSSEGTLLLLTKVSTSGATTPAGRSYNGHPWEGVQPTTIEFDCSAVTECTALLLAPDNPMTEDVDESQDTFRVNVIATPEPSTDEEAAARFLLHATFGPKKSEVTQLADDPAGLPAAMQSWINDQLAEPASLHREYVRRRSNTKWRVNGRNSANGVAGLISPCQIGSRWHSFAFTTDDEAKNLTVIANADGGYDLLVEGVLRTQVSSFPLEVHDTHVTACEAAATDNVTCAAAGACDYDSVGNPATCMSYGAVRNAGADCYGACGATQGPCEFCGSGSCCRLGWADTSGGCDGTLGVQHRGHVCGPTHDTPFLGSEGVCAAVTELGADTACVTANCSYSEATPTCTATAVAPPAAEVSTSLTICYVIEGLGGIITLGSPDTCSGWANDIAGPIQLPNPPIAFAASPGEVLAFTAEEAVIAAMEDEPDAFILQEIAACTNPPTGQDTFMSLDGQYYKHDARLALVENTLEQPATGPLLSDPIMSDTCPSAPKSFLNKDTCRRRTECTETVYSDATITLDDEGIQRFFSAAGKYVFATVGLDVTAAFGGGHNPCERSWHQNTYSRWEQQAGVCGSDPTLDDATTASITQQLRKGTDCYERHGHVWYSTLGNENTGGIAADCTESQNPYVRDIIIEAPCNGNPRGASITVFDNPATCTALVVNASADCAAVDALEDATACEAVTFDDAPACSYTNATGPVCWTNVHPNKYDVFDYSVYEAIDPIAIAWSTKFKDNPLHLLAMAGEAKLDFSALRVPSDLLNNGDPAYSGTRFQGVIEGTLGSTANRVIWDVPTEGGPKKYNPQLALLGRYGDVINIADLPSYLISAELAEQVGSTATSVYDGSEACGSPGEVANDPTLGNRIPMFAGYRYYTGGSPNYAHAAAMMDIRHGRSVSQRSNKAVPWFTTAIKSPDQLRQRMAWALAQIFAIDYLGGTKDIMSEMYTNYYDILVRHSLGNFRDLLKEIAYSPVMGTWLTFKGSSSFASSGTYPDENFSREIMELFSIGLFNLNPDGTPVRDELGEPVPTYTNHDIMSFARIWTGFNPQAFRANLENREGAGNWVDPMYINPAARDLNPKTDLYGDYIGEKRPLCVEMPDRAFLRKGATYLYSGYTKPKGPEQPLGTHWIKSWNPDSLGFVTLATTSPLYQVLCAPDSDGLCQWQSETSLDENLECDGTECLVDTVHSVQVVSGDGETVYYEYKPVECVTLAFYENAKMIKAGQRNNRLMCADPRTASAGASCCQDADSTATTSQARCQYSREMVTFDTAMNRCGMVTNQYMNQYEVESGSSATDHMVSHGGNLFWHIYPQQGEEGGECWLGCQTAENPGNPNYVSQCKAPHETFEVRCCSDTAIEAEEGDNPNQAYVQNSVGPCANTAFGGPGSPISQMSTDRPWANGHVTNFADQNDDPDDDDGCLHAKTFEEAEAACAADGARLCTQAEIESNCDHGSGCEGDSAFIWTSTPCETEPLHVCNRHTWVDGPEYCNYYNDWVWMNRPCELQLQVDVSGYVWLVHGGAREGGEGWNLQDNDHPNYALDNLNVFRVMWNDADDNAVGGPGNWPHSGDDCASSGCVKEGLTCLCTPDITTTTVFTDSTTAPTRTEVLEQLHYGAPDVSIFDAGAYTEHATSTSEVGVWTTGGTDYTDMTIFRVNVGDKDVWLSNKDMLIGMGEFSFRNPPTHMSFTRPSTFEAEYETDALIDHIVEHGNTPLFICRLLILRFTTSNPSPRYLQVAADAFRTGTYNGMTYSGKYGDLSAAIAAILLDREARSDAIEGDPSHGKLREPILKIMGIMRSMEYTTVDDQEIILNGNVGGAGQYPYKHGSVFNFYQPDYAPTGAISDNGIVSPEAQLLDPPKYIAYLNGISGLVDFGLDACSRAHYQNGFGSNPAGGAGGSSSFETAFRTRLGQYETWGHCGTPDGTLTFMPDNANTDTVTALGELDLLLTGGRLNAYNKALIQAQYDDIATHGGVFTSATEVGTTHMVAFGAGRQHGTSMCIPNSEQHEVSCCAEGEDAANNGYQSRCSSWFDRQGIVLGKSPGCVEANTYEEAVATCEADGGRLCTVEEIEAGCVYNTGCGHSWDHLWTSSDCPDAGPAAVKKAQRLIVGTPEYSTTTAAPPKPGVRPSEPDIPFLNRGYKAVVIIYLYGGHDSWNHLVPLDNCGDKDMYAEYEEVRGMITMARNKLLPISVPAGTQPCDTFGVHHKAPNIKNMYEAGEVIFFANTGSLLAPITAEAYHEKTALVPFDLFSHLGQLRQGSSVHAQHTGAKGILGRMRDELSSQTAPYRCKTYSMSGNALAVSSKVPATMIDKNRGVDQLDSYSSLAPDWLNMSHRESENHFAETFSSLLESSLITTNAYGELLRNGGTAEQSLQRNFGHSSLSKQLKQIAKVTTIRNHPLVLSERDFFFTKFGNFDTHQNTNELDGMTAELDNGIKEFSDEMKAQGLWENVTIVTVSDFGRTLTGNGMGTDHAWAGHYTVAGGGLAGGQILGHYPTNLRPGDGTLEGASLNIGRGRMIPTTPWEGIWHGVAQWLDVEDMRYVLPNIGSWNVGETMYTRAQMYADTAPEPEPMPEPEPIDLTTGTLNGQCLGIWRLITPLGESVAIPTCVIPDPTVLPAGVTSYISLSGDIVSLISPNSPERQTFEVDFAADMAEAIGCSAEQVTINAITAIEEVVEGRRRLQDSGLTVDFTIWPDPTTGTPVEIEEVTAAFSEPGVELGGMPSTTVITPETVHVYAANCGADKIAEIGTKLASCCDASSNGADCSGSIPTTCSDACNSDMVPYWDDCSLTIAGMPTSEFTFDVAGMETFVNGVCTDGAGAATPPPPGLPPAAVSAPGVPGADVLTPGPDSDPDPDPVAVTTPTPTPTSTSSGGGGGYTTVLLGSLAGTIVVMWCASRLANGGKEEKGDGDKSESVDNPVGEDTD